MTRTAVNPFRIDVPEEDLVDLRRRIAATRWPERETGKSTTAALKQPPPHVMLPVGYTVFPGELFQAPRHWVKSAYHNLIYFNEAARGGHFAAWEEPQIFAEEMRAAFASLR